ncbi:hypothetical protein V8C35DRAFT_329378 [Trichoderma chlorosporum]
MGMGMAAFECRGGEAWSWEWSWPVVVSLVCVILGLVSVSVYVFTSVSINVNVFIFTSVSVNVNIYISVSVNFVLAIVLVLVVSRLVVSQQVSLSKVCVSYVYFLFLISSTYSLTPTIPLHQRLFNPRVLSPLLGSASTSCFTRMHNPSPVNLSLNRPLRLHCCSASARLFSSRPISTTDAELPRIGQRLKAA